MSEIMDNYTCVLLYWDTFSPNQDLIENFKYFSANRTQAALDLFREEFAQARRVNQAIGKCKLHSAYLLDRHITPPTDYTVFHHWVWRVKEVVEDYNRAVEKKLDSYKPVIKTAPIQPPKPIIVIPDYWKFLNERQKRTISILRKISPAMANEVGTEYQKTSLGS